MEHFPIQNEQWIHMACGRRFGHDQWWIGGLQAQDTAPVSTKEVLKQKQADKHTKQRKCKPKQESKQTNNQTKIFDC